MELTGLLDGEYHMAAAIFTDDVDNIVTVEKSVATGERVEYSVNMSHEAGVPIEIEDPIITPPDSGESPVELLEDLIADLKDYYEAEEIKNKGVYLSLLNDLKIALVALKAAEVTRPLGEKHPKLHDIKVKIVERLALNKLNKFVSEIKKQNEKGRVSDTAAEDLIEKAENIILELV